jgi:hypothetical protein
LQPTRFRCATLVLDLPAADRARRDTADLRHRRAARLRDQRSKDALAAFVVLLRFRPSLAVAVDDSFRKTRAPLGSSLYVQRDTEP